MSPNHLSAGILAIEVSVIADLDNTRKMYFRAFSVFFSGQSSRDVHGTKGSCHIKNAMVILIHYGGGKKYDSSKTIRQGLRNTLFSGGKFTENLH